MNVWSDPHTTFKGDHMKKDEQTEFVDILIDNVRDEIINKVTKYAPEDWDGIELRQFIADSFNDCVMKGTMSRSRRIAYNKKVIRMPR